MLHYIKQILCSILPVWLRPRYILEMRTRSPHWPVVRRNHLEKEPRCTACDTDKDLEVHHVIPVSVNPAREEDPENLITLCGSGRHNCHLVFGHFMNYKCYNPDVRKMVKEYRAKMKKCSCLDK